MLNKILDVVLFQIGWFASVLGAAHGLPWLGPLVAVPIIGVHLWQAPDRLRGLFIVLFIGCLGTLIDSALGYVGILVFRDSLIATWICPPWLIALWTIFATTLQSSLAWLAERLGLAALLGGIFGPVSYYAGQSLGSLNLGGNRPVALATLFVLWTLLLPLLVHWTDLILKNRRPV